MLLFPVAVFGIALITYARQDTRYLTPIINEVKSEQEEREAWDTAKIDKSGGH